MTEIITQEVLSLQDAIDNGCLCCSELAIGYREDGAKTCGDPICGIKVRELAAKTTEE